MRVRPQRVLHPSFKPPSIPRSEVRCRPVLPHKPSDGPILMHASLPPVHARKALVPSAFSRPESCTSFTRLSLIFSTSPTPTYSDVGLPWEPLPAARSASFDTFDNTFAYSSRGFCAKRDSTLPPEHGTPKSGFDERERGKHSPRFRPSVRSVFTVHKQVASEGSSNIMSDVTRHQAEKPLPPVRIEGAAPI